MSQSNTEERKRVQAYIDKGQYDWIKQKIKEEVFSSHSHAIRRAVSILIAHTEGKLLQ